MSEPEGVRVFGYIMGGLTGLTVLYGIYVAISLLFFSNTKLTGGQRRRLRQIRKKRR